MVSAYTEIISIRVDDALLFKIKENLRPGENVSDFIRKAMRSYLAIVQSEQGDAKYTMEVSVFSMWVFRVASSYFFAGTLKMGVLGVWIGMYVDWVFRSLLFVIRYKRGKWLNKRVVQENAGIGKRWNSKNMK